MQDVASGCGVCGTRGVQDVASGHGVHRALGQHQDAGCVGRGVCRTWRQDVGCTGPWGGVRTRGVRDAGCAGRRVAEPPPSLVSTVGCKEWGVGLAAWLTSGTV